ncbi:Protein DETOXIFICATION 34 [Glycine soja]
MSAIYFYLLFGMSSALATLCGQAFGAGQIQSTCIYVQRSWIILTATCTILLPIFVYATPILKLLGQDEGIAELAGRYSIQLQYSGLGRHAAPWNKYSNMCSCLQYAWQVAAIYSFCMKMFLSLLLGILFMTVIFFSKDEFAKIFTDSEDMILADSDLAHLLGVTIVLNSASQVMSGLAIGSRWQVMVGYINLACYYIVGLPIGIFLGFKLHLGVKGLWGGTMCSSILQILVLFTIILKTKWSKEVTL